MEGLTSSPVQELHLLNLRLAPQLEIAAAAIKDNDPNVMVDSIRDLLAGLSKGATLIEDSSSLRNHPAWKDEVGRYRKNLVKIRQLLPEIQNRLLARKAELNRERNHLSTVSAWAVASRDQL